MVSAEMLGIILTGAISSVDLLVNAVALCMSGKCEISCCGSTFKHADCETELTDVVRRMSNCPPPSSRQEENNENISLPDI